MYSGKRSISITDVRTLCCAILILALCRSVLGQGRPSFEVASIRLVAPNSPSAVERPGQMVDSHQDTAPILPLRVVAGRVTIRNNSLQNLIARAFGVRRTQVIGPPWLSRDRFDLDAKVSGEIPRNRVNEALQALLEDRFALKFHRETRLVAGYALQVGRSGPKLQPATVAGENPSLPMPRADFRGSVQTLGNATTIWVGRSNISLGTPASRRYHRPSRKVRLHAHP